MNKQQIIAAMESIVAKAEAEGRAMTAEESAEFDRLKAQCDAIDANADRRANLTALRQASGITTDLEQLALAPNQALASLPQFARPTGNNQRIADFIRAQIGLGGVQAAQTLGTGSEGGFMVPGFLSAELFDKARARARTIQAGVRVMPLPTGDVALTTVEDDPSFASHAENASIDETNIVLGSVSLRANTKVALIRASVELMEDSPNFADMVDSVLAAAFAVEMDRLSLYGSGVGESAGIAIADGVTEIDGAALSTWSPFARAIQAVRTQNYEAGAFITTPGVLGAIDALVEGGGSNQPLARPPSLQNTAFLDTTSIPEGGSPTGSIAITGEWSNYIIGIRTPLVIEATRVGGDAFSKLSVLIRAYARLDARFVRRAAFARVVGIPTPSIG